MASEDKRTVEPQSSIVNRLLENLGAHGIPNIKRAQTIYRKCFWITAFVVGMTLFSLHCLMNALKFMDRDVSVNHEMRYDPVIDFPAVTICNLNAVKGSVLKNYTHLHEMLGPTPVPEPSPGNNSPPFSTTPMQPTVMPQNPTSSGPGPMGPGQGQGPGPMGQGQGQGSGPMGQGQGPGSMGYGQGQSSYPPGHRKRFQDWGNMNFGLMDSQHTLISETTDIIGAMDYDKRFETGHELDNMLLSCTFKGYPCSPSNFTRFYNYLYGNCYTFNSGRGKIPIEKIQTAGPMYGLTLSLYIEQDEYIPDIQEGAGIRVDVHPQNKMSFPEDKGLNVPPGTEAFVSIRKTQIKRRGYPYTNCTSETNRTIFSEHFENVEYSKLMCEKDCFYKNVWKCCNCSDVRYRYDDSDVPACNSSNPKDAECIYNVENYGIPCRCTFACEEDIFNHVVSYSLWPNDKHKPLVQEGIKEISDSLRKSVENDTGFVEKNVVKLNVYYDELTYDYIYHTPTYGEYDLLSDIGGNVGLWIGISALTVVELVELLYDVVILCFVKARKAGEKDTTGEKSDLELVDNSISGKVHAESSMTGQKY